MEGWFYPNWPTKTPAVPACQVGRFVADGSGNMMMRVTTSMDGDVSTNDTFYFTYQVNADCTGSATPLAGSAAHPVDFTVVDGGKQLLIISTQPGDAWSGEAIHQ
jgi:hypothetical protein